MIVFIIAIILSIIQLVFLTTQFFYNMGIFEITWIIFIFLITSLSILIITKKIKIETFYLFWKKKKAMERRMIILDILKMLIGIIYVLGLFGMFLQGVFPIYTAVFINGLLFAPIGLFLERTKA